MNTKKYTGLFYDGGKISGVEDVLAVEESLSIAINGEPFTVTMRTPGSEEELIIGLLFTEEVYREATKPVITIQTTNGKGYITDINVTLPKEKILKDFAGSRNIISASSCGLCGRTSFEDTKSHKTISETGKLDPGKVYDLFEKMSQYQNDFKESGGTHASAAFTLEGELLDIREDIGRHNAVDKVVGALILKNKLHQAKILTVSGRISYEIVNKALSAGIPFLASVSAPSNMAIENATAAGMTLMAFCRNHKLTVYSHAERIIKNDYVPANK